MSGNSDDGIANPQNSRDFEGERGRSDWDRPHIFTSNFSGEMPWMQRSFCIGGWQFTGTVRAYSGAPFTPQVSNVNLPERNVSRVTTGTISESNNGREMQFALRYRF